MLVADLCHDDKPGLYREKSLMFCCKRHFAVVPTYLYNPTTLKVLNYLLYSSLRFLLLFVFCLVLMSVTVH